MLMKKFFKNCAMFLALGAMSLSLNAAAPGDDLTSSFVNANFADGANGWTVTAQDMSKITYATATGEFGFEGTFLKAESAKKFQNYSVAQEVAGLPLGDYEVSAKIYQIEETNYGKGGATLYVNNSNKKAGNSSAAGAAAVTVATRVVDGKMKVEFKHTGGNRNTIVAFGDLKVVLKSIPELAPALATAETFASQKMLADYSARYAKAIAEAKAHSGVVDSAYMALCTELETLNAAAQGSIDDFAAYAAAIAKAEAFVAASTIADKAAIEATIAEHKANYEAAAQSPKAQGWVAALELAVGQFDATYFVVNPSFTDGLNGWTLDTVAKNANSPIVVEFVNDYKGFASALYLHNTLNEKQAFKKVELSQTVTGLPNGDYYVHAKVWRNEDGNNTKGTITLYANDKNGKFANSTADAPGAAKVKVRVTDGTLAIKISETDGRNGQLVFGDIKLEYKGFESWAKIDGNTATASNIEELIDALKDERLAGQDAVIELTAAGPYELGGSIKEYAAFKSLTFKSNAGAKVSGRITAQPVRVETLTFDGITFVGSDATSIYFSNVDSIDVLTVKNCTFQDLGKEHIIGFRGSNNKAYIGTIDFTGNTVNNFGLSKADGGDHAFPVNKGSVATFKMTENVFNNYAGKQFLQFANLYAVAGSDSIINITVENNVFNGWGNPAGNTGSAENFIEFSNGTGYNNGVKININNNIFNKNITDTTTYRVPVMVKFAKGITAEYLAKSEVNIMNNLLIPDSVVYKFNLDPAAEEVVALPTNLKANIEAGEITVNRKDLFQKDFPEYAYVAGEKMLTTHPMYTAGKDGKYIGLASMYYEFNATATGATVSTAEGLIQAMAYTFEGVENPVITMLDCTDEGGVYNVGTGYKKMGANANLTIKAAAGATPVVSGTLAGANYNMESLTIEGLKFIAGGNPIQMMNGNDRIEVLTVKNCTFEQFGAEQVGLFRAGNGYLGKFVFVGNIVSEYGYGKQDGGNHMFQFNQKNFTIGALEFTENQFIEYGGKQFINFSNAAPAAGTDSIMHINFSNNTLYGFSGNGWWNGAAQYRNFIEFTCGSKYGWKGAEIDINNNLFYELNHTCDTLGIANRLALGTDGTNETYKVNVLNNVFYPDTMMVQVELGKVMESCNLPIFDNENIKANRNDLYLAALGLTPETIWYKGEALAIPHTSPLMKAGVDGTYVGAKANYVKDVDGIPTVAYITTDQVMGEGAVATTNDPIYNYLNEGYDFNMVLVVVSDDKKADVSADIDLSKYDAAIIAEQFAGDAVALTPDGPLAINKLNIPTIYNKTYAFKSKRALANGGSATGADANVGAIVVAKENQAWGLFDGIEFTTDTIVIFKELTDDNGVLGGEKSVKGINYIKGIDNLVAGKLADPAIADVSAVSACINYVPAGTVIASETTAAPMFIFGMNSGAICANGGENITEDGLKLWKNALNTLLGNIDETPRNLVGLKKVAYVTADKEMAEGSEDAVLAALSADESLNIVKMLGTDVNVEGFDAVIVQEALGGGDAVLKPEGALGLANLSVPTIYNKMYAFKDGRAFTSVGKAATGKEAGETVLSITKTMNSSLFDGVFAEGAKEAQMFVGTTNDTGAEGTKALNYAAGVENAGTQLATPTGVEAAVAINYIKAGEVLGDATLKTNVLTLGMNYGAISKPGNVTEANIQLWKNAVAIMVGAKELTIEALPDALNTPVVLNKVFANNGIVYVNAAEAAVINVYSMTGSLVKSVEVKEGLNAINGLSAGQVYMIRCNDEVSKVIL